ncbi:pilin [Pseudoteredinibacter isoporae]|uniref:pilin n=1 Tax=Pseudoteredinibacter isoporae TaxID=570281 RepID=UPI0031078A34
MTSNYKEKGFTLVELMIVIAIIGILAALALPAYQDYTSRTRVAEPVTLLRAMKAEIQNYFADNGSFPTVSELNVYAGPQVTSGEFTASITDGGSGIYVATMKNAVGGRINNSTVALHFTTTTGGLVEHSCRPGASNPVPNEFLPWECRL